MCTHSRGLMLLFAALLLLTNRCAAHGLDASHRVLPGQKVQIEAGYDTGEPVIGGRVRVFRGKDELLTEGKLDEKGTFLFAYDQPENLRVEINDSYGHKATLRLTAQELGGASPPSASSDRTKPSPWKDVLLGITFLLALAAFVISLQNAKHLRASKTN